MLIGFVHFQEDGRVDNFSKLIPPKTFLLLSKTYIFGESGIHYIMIREMLTFTLLLYFPSTQRRKSSTPGDFLALNSTFPKGAPT